MPLNKQPRNNSVAATKSIIINDRVLKNKTSNWILMVILAWIWKLHKFIFSLRFSVLNPMTIFCTLHLHYNYTLVSFKFASLPLACSTFYLYLTNPTQFLWNTLLKTIFIRACNGALCHLQRNYQRWAKWTFLSVKYIAYV